MSHSWAIPIEKLMMWRAFRWVNYEAKVSKLVLKIHYDQLLITTENKIMESFNMNSKIKGVYKEDVLILIDKGASQEIRKLRFQIKENVELSLKKLNEHFPILSYNSIQSKNVIQSNYRNLDEVLKTAMEGSDISTLRLPSSYSQFVKVCLLDPTFPQIIQETKKILDNLK